MTYIKLCSWEKVFHCHRKLYGGYIMLELRAVESLILYSILLVYTAKVCIYKELWDKQPLAKTEHELNSLCIIFPVDLALQKVSHIKILAHWWCRISIRTHTQQVNSLVEHFSYLLNVFTYLFLSLSLFSSLKRVTQYDEVKYEEL